MTIGESFQKSIAGWQMAGSRAITHVQAKAGVATDIVSRELAETVIGLRYGASLVGAKARETVTSVKTGVSGIAAKAGESFGNIAGSFSPYKLLLPVLLIVFVVVLVAIGYSGLGAPAARVAEREYVHRR